MAYNITLIPEDGIGPEVIGIAQIILEAITTKSFARIHQGNLINCGVLPLIFKNEENYNRLEQVDVLELKVDKFKIRYYRNKK